MVHNRPIHFLLVVWENAKVGAFGSQPSGFFIGVGMVDPEQYE